MSSYPGIEMSDNQSGPNQNRENYPLEHGTALVFSGGGARGAYSAGVALAFKQAGLCPEIVSGASVGALIAAMVASGKEERCVEVWRHLTPSKVYQPRSMVRFFLSFVSNFMYPCYSSEPLARLIAAEVDPEAIRRSPRRLIITCYNQSTHTVERFDNRCEDIHKVLLASTSIPLAFPPVKMNGHDYVDLGVTNLPLKPVIHLGAEKIYVVMCDHPEDYKRSTLNNLDWAVKIMNLAQRDNMLLDIELARRMNLIADGSSYKFVDLRILQPSHSLGLGFLDFHKRHLIQRAIDLGIEDTLRFLDRQTVGSSPAGTNL